MKSITIYISLILLLYSGIAIGNNPSYNLDDIAAQFSAMMDRNKQNDALGLSANNEYILSVTFEDRTPVVSSDCFGWVRRYNLSESSDYLQPEGVVQSLCDEYKEFNEKNTSKLEHYILYIEFPHIAFETNYTQSQVGSMSAWDYFMENKGSTDEALYNLMVSELTAKLPDLNQGQTNDLTFKEDKEQLISVVGEYSYKNNGKEYDRALQSYRFKKTDFLNTNFIRDFKKEVKSKSDKFSLEILMQTTIEFFGEKVNLGLSCEELSGFFELGSDVQAYWDGWCTALNQETYPGISLDYLQTYIWPICIYLEEYVALGGTLDNDIDEDFFFISPIDYLAYINASAGNGYLSRLDKLIDDLNATCSLPDGTTPNEKKKIQAITEIIRSPSADLNFYNQLTAGELTCLTTLYLQFYNTGFAGWLTNEDYYFLDKVFSAIQNKKAQDCQDFLDAIYEVENSTSRIFTACDELFTFQGTEFNLVSEISNVVLKANNVSESNINDFEDGGDYEGRLYGWKPASFFTPCVNKYGHVDYFTYHPENSNHIEFRLDYHAGFADNAATPVLPKWGIVCSRSGENVWDVTEDPIYHPFAVVGVIGKADKVTIFTDCSSYQCKMPLQAMSAFQFAWMIEKKEDDDAFDKAILSLEIISSAVGVAQAMAAWKTGAAARAVFLGMTSTGELVGSSLTLSTIESIGADLGEETFAHAQKINKVLGFVALGSGAGQIGLSLVDALRAQTVASNIVKAGISFENSSELSKRLADLRGIIDESPLLYSKALTDAGVSDNIIAKLNAISDLENKIIVSGHILTSPNMIQKVNANPELFDFFESLANSTYIDNTKHVLKLSDAEMESVINKLDGSSNPELILNVVSSDELTHLILRAEKKGIDIFNSLNSVDAIIDFDDFLLAIENINFYNFLKNAQNTLDFEKSMVTWGVLVGVPDDIRFNALNLQKVYDHIDVYGGTKIDFDTPIKSHQQWIDDLGTSSLPYPSVTAYLPSGYSEISYLPDYVNVLKGAFIGEGFGKRAWYIIGDPEKVLLKVKHDSPSGFIDPTNHIPIIEEYNLIKKLENLGFPVSKYYGITKHHGVVTLVKKRYATSFKSPEEIADFSDDLIQNEGLGDLNLVREKLLEYEVEVDDLQFLISDEGRIVIDDPLPNPLYTDEPLSGLTPQGTTINQQVKNLVNEHMFKVIDRILVKNLMHDIPYTTSEILNILDNQVNTGFIWAYFDDGFNDDLFTVLNGIIELK